MNSVINHQTNVRKIIDLKMYNLLFKNRTNSEIRN